MTATQTASQRGKANRRKGINTEQAVARYLRAVGFPQARRAEHNGWRTTEHTAPDPLDIVGIPGVVISVKNDAKMTIRPWLDKAEQVKNREGADLALLIVRQRGKAEPARWLVLLTLASLSRLVAGTRPATGPVVPVSLELGELVPLLHAAGYGPAQDNSEPGEVAT